jgi:hypothetical protein
MESYWRTLLTLLLLGGGTLGFAFFRRDLALVAAAPAGIVGLNFAMHELYGDHFILYALHWQTALLVLLGGLAFWRGRCRIAGDAALAVFAVLVVWNSSVQMQWLLARLASR